MYNYHLCREEDSHIGERHGGYYMVMDTKDHVWRNVKGETLDAPVTKEQSDSMTLVHDTGELWAFRGTVALDAAGHPHITLYVGEGMGLRTGGPKQVRHFRWTGHEWTNNSNPELPVAVGDMVVASPSEVNLLLAGKNAEGNGELAWWRSVDGGQRFVQDDALLSLKKTGMPISSLIRNAHPDARVLVAGKRGNSDFCKLYLVGDNGPVQRPKAEAEHLSEAEKARPIRRKNR